MAGLAGGRFQRDTHRSALDDVAFRFGFQCIPGDDERQRLAVVSGRQQHGAENAVGGERLVGLVEDVEDQHLPRSDHLDMHAGEDRRTDGISKKETASGEPRLCLRKASVWYATPAERQHNWRCVPP
jgi:hypothetical protein